MVDCSYDIPLLKSLQLLLTTSVVQEQVLLIHVYTCTCRILIFNEPSYQCERTIF